MKRTRCMIYDIQVPGLSALSPEHFRHFRTSRCCAYPLHSVHLLLLSITLAAMVPFLPTPAVRQEVVQIPLQEE